jgi:hypothetical protein
MVERGVKHHNPNPHPLTVILQLSYTYTLSYLFYRIKEWFITHISYHCFLNREFVLLFAIKLSDICKHWMDNGVSRQITYLQNIYVTLYKNTIIFLRIQRGQYRPTTVNGMSRILNENKYTLGMVKAQRTRYNTTITNRILFHFSKNRQLYTLFCCHSAFLINFHT